MTVECLQILYLTNRATKFNFVLWKYFMKFYIFLNQLANDMDCNSATKLYRKLGGKKTLSLGLRQFQFIFSGQAKPTTALLMSILSVIKFDSYKVALLSYFKSVAEEDNSKLISYLEGGLRESVQPPDKKQWDDTSNIRLYTEEQINFLKSNPEVLRLHQKILLFNDVFIRKEDPIVVEQLCKINLAIIDGEHVRSTAEAFKIPTEFNSLPRTTRLASEYIIESMKTFLSFEGSESQKLEMVTQAISKEDLNHILNETTKLKQWIQSLGQKEIVEGVSIPFIYIGFAKGLVKGEIQ